MPIPTASTTVERDADLFTAWLTQTPVRSRARGRAPRRGEGGLRFAFYGRTSTGRFQDPASSRQWQLDSAMSVVDGNGRITVEFFDVGHSRQVLWP